MFGSTTECCYKCQRPSEPPKHRLVKCVSAAFVHQLKEDVAAYNDIVSGAARNNANTDNASQDAEEVEEETMGLPQAVEGALAKYPHLGTGDQATAARESLIERLRGCQHAGTSDQTLYRRSFHPECVHPGNAASAFANNFFGRAKTSPRLTIAVALYGRLCHDCYREVRGEEPAPNTGPSQACLTVRRERHNSSAKRQKARKTFGSIGGDLTMMISFTQDGSCLPSISSSEQAEAAGLLQPFQDFIREAGRIWTQTVTAQRLSLLPSRTNVPSANILDVTAPGTERIARPPRVREFPLAHPQPLTHGQLVAHMPPSGKLTKESLPCLTIPVVMATLQVTYGAQNLARGLSLEAYLSQLSAAVSQAEATQRMQGVRQALDLGLGQVGVQALDLGPGPVGGQAVGLGPSQARG